MTYFYYNIHYYNIHLYYKVYTHYWPLVPCEIGRPVIWQIVLVSVVCILVRRIVVQSQQEQRPVHFNDAFSQTQRFCWRSFSSYKWIMHHINGAYEKVHSNQLCHPECGWEVNQRQVNINLVPRVCLFAGYVVAWLWGNRIYFISISFPEYTLGTRLILSKMR
jgi:hypothetical protein